MTRMPASRARRLVEKLPTRFRIYPEERTGFYFEVWIYPTLFPMISHIDRLRAGTPAAIPSGIEGYVHPLKGKRHIGYILLREKYCDQITIIHECWHAVAWWSKRKRWKPDSCLSWNNWEKGIPASSTHERMAEAIGKMAAQIWRRVHGAR